MVFHVTNVMIANQVAVDENLLLLSVLTFSLDFSKVFNKLEKIREIGSHIVSLQSTPLF